MSLALNPNKSVVNMTTEGQNEIYDKVLRSAQALVKDCGLDTDKGDFFYLSSGTRSDNGYGDHSNALDISCGNQLGSRLHYKYLYALARRIHSDHPSFVVALSMHVRHIHVQIPREGGGRLVLEVSPSSGVYNFDEYDDEKARDKYDVQEGEFAESSGFPSWVWWLGGIAILVFILIAIFSGRKKS